MTEGEIYRNIISTVVLVVGTWVLQFVISKAVEKQVEWESENRQRWQYYFRNIRIAVICIGIVLIWATELKALALSLVAFLVAIIVATKELILCLLGGLLQALNRPFSIGDRIEVGSFKGDVINHNLMITQLLEVGPGKSNQYTGREITIPNSVFLSNSVFNETSLSKYVLHSFTIAMPRSTPWKEIERQILEKSSVLVGCYKDQAEKSLKHFSKKRSLDVPSLDPKVFVSLQEHDKTLITVRLPVPAKDKGQIEQKIVKSLVF